MAEQKRGWIQPGISVGNVIVLVTMIVSVAIGWARLESGLADHDRRIVDLEDADKSLMSDRMREARDVADMKADMRWIRVTLEHLERDWKSREWLPCGMLEFDTTSELRICIAKRETFFWSDAKMFNNWSTQYVVREGCQSNNFRLLKKNHCEM